MMYIMAGINAASQEVLSMVIKRYCVFGVFTRNPCTLHIILAFLLGILTWVYLGGLSL